MFRVMHAPNDPNCRVGNIHQNELGKLLDANGRLFQNSRAVIFGRLRLRLFYADFFLSVTRNSFLGSAPSSNSSMLKASNPVANRWTVSLLKKCTAKPPPLSNVSSPLAIPVPYCGSPVCLTV